MAVVRASLGDCPIILSSATPSLETVINVEQGRYQRVELPARHGKAQMPSIEAIDMRLEKPEAGKWLSPVLISAVKERIGAGEQSMLFLNRRGYAPLTLCRTCGYRMQSPDSSSWLVEHKFSGRLVCHHSGFSMPKPKCCPKCDAEDSLVGCGPGVERVAEEVQAYFPEQCIEIMSSDTVGTPQALKEMISRMTAGEIDVLVGTQMMAKGHHFPNLTLVGVVDADLGLSGGDLRAAERTFQLLYQVAGRAGRSEKLGQVMLQTYMPEHEVMQALVAGDRDAFMDMEADAREDLGLPPFGRLASVIVAGPVESEVQAAAHGLARQAPLAEGLVVLGPAPAPFAYLRGKHRQRLLLRAEKTFNIQAYLREWLPRVSIPGKVRVAVDIDPYSFL
jgi:primosomal protein N' (replication factor Y)